MPGLTILATLSLIILSPVISSAQIGDNKNEILLIGQVTNKSNGAPITNQEIIVTTDTLNEPNFLYTAKLYTDNEGYFYDTIATPEQKGSFDIHTKDFENISHDTTVYYRFNWSENNVLEANFVLPNALGSSVYQANFKYMSNPGGNNNLVYQFTDLTNSSAIVLWEWDFGDGFTSIEQNPLHTYSEAGVYRIKLSTTKFSQQSQEFIYSSMVKVINATTKSYYSMGGHVKAGYFPIDHGIAYLYKIESGEYLPIDTSKFNAALGYYYFPQLIEGQYIVKADLISNSVIFNEYLATYYSNKQYWEEADTIFHYSNNYELDIQLTPNQQSSAGPGIISGNINYGFENKNVAANDVEILLLDENDNFVNVCHSDIDGNFCLENLELDIYKLYAEVTGKNTNPVVVEIDESNATLSFVNITIENNNVNGSVNSGINNNYLDRLIGDIYPNPVQNMLHIDLIGTNITLSYELLNHLGQVLQNGIITGDMPLNKLSIQTSELPSAFYFLSISDENKMQITRKFVKK